jgi:tetratricopeptide (TPR) repeat protein
MNPTPGDAAAYSEFRQSYTRVLTFCYSALDSVDRTRDSVAHGEICGITHHAAVRLAQLFFTVRRFDSSAAILTTLVTRAPLSKYDAAPAYVLLAQSLQGSGKLDSAMIDYNKAVTILDPPIDRNGQLAFSVFNVPHLVYRIYAKGADSIKSHEAFTTATEYYKNLIARYPKSGLSASSEAVMARLYTDEENWPAAIGSLEKLIDSSGRTNVNALLQIADIRAKHLKEYDSALAIYEVISSRLQGRDTLSRSVLLLKQGMAYMSEKRYVKGRQMFVDLQKRFPAYYASNAAPQLATAQSFELEGNWDRAETEYRFLLSNYPSSEEAYSTYLYLADQFTKQGRKLDADKLLQTAEQVFEKAASQGAGTRQEALALSFKAELFRRKSLWREAAVTLSSIFDKFPDTDVGRNAISMASSIYRKKLNDTAAADSLFRVYATMVTKIE